MKLVKVCAGPMYTYWFPEEGKALADVTVAVQWSPYGGDLYWVFRPFAPVTVLGLVMRPVDYPGHAHAENEREAARLARELFTTSVACLRWDHADCTGHLASRDDWPDAPVCACDCHKARRS